MAITPRSLGTSLLERYPKQQLLALITCFGSFPFTGAWRADGTVYGYYTSILFHRPRLNKIKLTIVIQVSATGMAMNTPVGPISRYFARK
jgi:hypothetical protein